MAVCVVIALTHSIPRRHSFAIGTTIVHSVPKNNEQEPEQEACFDNLFECMRYTSKTSGLVDHREFHCDECGGKNMKQRSIGLVRCPPFAVSSAAFPLIM